MTGEGTVGKETGQANGTILLSFFFFKSQCLSSSCQRSETNTNTLPRASLKRHHPDTTKRQHTGTWPKEKAKSDLWPHCGNHQETCERILGIPERVNLEMTVNPGTTVLS